MDRLVLSLLGRFEARQQSGQSVVVRTTKGRALLAYLACHSDQSHPRGKLATLLWPDMPESCARHNLRQTLCVLRASLPASVSAALRAESDSVALDAGCLVVDAVRFEQLAGEGTPAALEAAAALYRGDLLAGISVDGPDFRLRQGAAGRGGFAAVHALESTR